MHDYSSCESSKYVSLTSQYKPPQCQNDSKAKQNAVTKHITNMDLHSSSLTT